jgi:hypothetical protein
LSTVPQEIGSLVNLESVVMCGRDLSLIAPGVDKLTKIAEDLLDGNQNHYHSE